MLEAINLSKVYKLKKGVPVKALDNVSIKFPEKGMVFLLGKSGSGKSTLLNLLGGLDKYDEGEIRIKGVSSKAFSQKHFDSYRNTYIGFIFQEYNVLEEFSVGANIALSIELQGRKATDGEINDILHRVDLAGLGNRKPNELSGGQKQRVAIARALIKNPEIIMADEPTGALDSNTGKQIFDTLKKLSENKLVIVVSHDREFAEQYADRIIELSDGKIISDMEASNSADIVTENLEFRADGITVATGYHLTEDDRKAINDYIDKIAKGEINIDISKSRSGKKFVTTDESKIKEGNGKFGLVKSHLPFRNALKIGAGGLKHKKIRLAVTIILSCISFGLFGLSDTFGAYNHVKTCTKSLLDSNIDSLSVAKEKKMPDGYWLSYGYNLSADDMIDLQNNTGVNMHGVFGSGLSLSFLDNTDSEKETSQTEYDIYIRSFNGFGEINQSTLDDFGYKLISGRLPEGGKDEIAISEYIFEVFKKTDYTDGSKENTLSGTEKTIYREIKSYDDLLGKSVTLNGTKYTVTGIVDTHLDISRYTKLTEKVKNKTKAQKLLDYALSSEFYTAIGYSYSGVAMVAPETLQKIITSSPDVHKINQGYLTLYSENSQIDPDTLTSLDTIDKNSVKWVNGAKDELGPNEIIAYGGSFSVDGLYDENGNIIPSKLPVMNASFNLNKDIYSKSDDDSSPLEKNGFDDEFKIVGIIPENEKLGYLSSSLIVSDRLLNLLCDKSDLGYSFAVGGLPKDYKSVEPIVKYCYNAGSSVKYPIQNSVTFELDSVNSFIKSAAKVFFYIGIGFAVFAALMLANFIGTSINYKKKDIGILRAIGSRSSDVFKIFFSESAVIALINFVLSSIGVFAVTEIINTIIRKELGILITVLNFGIRQILLLFAVSIVVAFTASYIPVKRIASKKPIDAIRER